MDSQERDDRAAGDDEAPVDAGAEAGADAETDTDADADAATDADGEPDESGERATPADVVREAPDAGTDEHVPDFDDPEDPAHEHHSDDLETVAAAVVTISTTRTLDDDPAGDAIASLLEAEGHVVTTRELVNDDYDSVQRAVDALVRREDVDAVVTTGGTGVAPDDVTVEAVRPLLMKELPGFGELFRTLSREEIGTRVIATRACAGIASGVPVFCLPGSEDAARLGTGEIVVPQVPHLAGLAERPEGSEEESDLVGTRQRSGEGK